MTSNQRLKEVQKFLNFRTQQEFADALGIKQGSLSDIYRGKVGVSSAILLTLSKDYSINIEWLKTGEGRIMTGEGKMLKDESEDAPTPAPAIVWDETTPHAGVPIYDVDFACGFVEMFNDHSTHPIGFLSFPPYTNPEKYAVVYATGDSMSPEIEHRAMLIIGRNSLPASTIFYGDIYGIETITGERTIKRVVRSTEKGHIRLVPSNPAYGDYQDFPLEVVSKVYKVYHVLNQKSY